MNSKVYLERKISEYHGHAEFKKKNNGMSDIALIKLEKEVNFQWDVAPICLPCNTEGSLIICTTEHM